MVVDPERHNRCDLYSAVVLFLLFFSLVCPQSVKTVWGLPELIAKCFHCHVLLLVDPVTPRAVHRSGWAVRLAHLLLDADL